MTYRVMNRQQVQSVRNVIQAVAIRWPRENERPDTDWHMAFEFILQAKLAGFLKQKKESTEKWKSYERDIIRGPGGFIYEYSPYGLAYYSWREGSRRPYRPAWFEPRGYPGEMEAFSTQQIFINKLGMPLRGVPKLSIEEYEREMGA